MLQGILIAIIRGYQVGISSWTPATCRFVPSCSSYALEVIHEHGPIRGSWLAIRRLCRCHPWGGFGLDPVPPTLSQGPANNERRIERVQ